MGTGKTFDRGLIQAHGLAHYQAGFFGWPIKAQARRPLVYAVAILLHPVLRKGYLSNSDEATGNRMTLNQGRQQGSSLLLTRRHRKAP
jgi:Phage shock protein PspD (Phageshock_PspD)